MKKYLGLLLGSASLLCFAHTGAVAQTTDQGSNLTNGPYVGIAGGGAFPSSISPHGGRSDVQADLKDGWAGQGTVGYGFGNGIRGELELGYRRNDIDSVRGSAFHQGALGMSTAMINGLYDFDLSDRGLANFIPHIGVGAGWANSRFDNAGFFNRNIIHGSSNAFAYQGIAGVDYVVSPGVKLGLDYHYIGTDNMGFRADPARDTTRMSLQNNEVLVGLRFEFNPPQPQVAAAPPPPPPPAPLPAAAPAPAPEVQRAFQVFFDFDKSDITDAASRVVQQAADNVKAGHVSQINVTGHTDTVGSAAYNQGLSERRAAAVKQQLVADGVSDGEISTVGVGKTGLLVPTADGVREPQNRRAEIVLQH